MKTVKILGIVTSILVGILGAAGTWYGVYCMKQAELRKKEQETVKIEVPKDTNVDLKIRHGEEK